MGTDKNIKLHIVTDIKWNQIQLTFYKMSEVSTSELACVYSALILHDDDIDITGEKMTKLINAAKVNVEPFWPGLFAKALQGRNIGDLICNVGSAPAAGAGGGGGSGSGDASVAAAVEEKKEEKKESSDEESDDDMGFGLF